MDSSSSEWEVSPSGSSTALETTSDDSTDNTAAGETSDESDSSDTGSDDSEYTTTSTDDGEKPQLKYECQWSDVTGCALLRHDLSDDISSFSCWCYPVSRANHIDSFSSWAKGANCSSKGSLNKRKVPRRPKLSSLLSLGGRGYHDNKSVYDFHHYKERLRYIEQYRNRHTCQGVGARTSGTCPTLGLDAPDPYMTKLRNINYLLDKLAVIQAFTRGDSSIYNSIPLHPVRVEKELKTSSLPVKGDKSPEAGKTTPKTVTSPEVLTQGNSPDKLVPLRDDKTMPSLQPPCPPGTKHTPPELPYFYQKTKFKKFSDFKPYLDLSSPSSSSPMSLQVLHMSRENTRDSIRENLTRQTHSCQIRSLGDAGPPRLTSRDSIPRTVSECNFARQRSVEGPNHEWHQNPTSVCISEVIDLGSKRNCYTESDRSPLPVGLCQMYISPKSSMNPMPPSGLASKSMCSGAFQGYKRLSCSTDSKQLCGPYTRTNGPHRNSKKHDANNMSCRGLTRKALAYRKQVNHECRVQQN